MNNYTNCVAITYHHTKVNMPS